MASLINLNQSNIVNNGFNNILEYRFTNSSLNFENAELAVASIQMFNSVFNVNASLYNNHKFLLSVIDASDAPRLEEVVLQDGYYSYSDMNRVVQAKLKEIGCYLINESGQDVFYMRISENPTFYACQIDFRTPPSVLPTGWSLPPTGYWSANLPSASLSHAIRLYPDNNFNQLIGFSLDFDPPFQTILPKSGSPYENATILSDISPKIHPVSLYNVRCNLISNPFSTPSDLLTTFNTQGTDIGQLINYTPPELIWVSIADGSYSSLRLELNDELQRFIKFEDPNIQINLIIRQRS